MPKLCHLYSETTELIKKKKLTSAAPWDIFSAKVWCYSTDSNILSHSAISAFILYYFVTQEQDSWITIDQLDATCFIISLFNAQHVSDVNTSILRSLRIICWVISWVVLLWFDVCWCYGVVWLGWSNKHKIYKSKTFVSSVELKPYWKKNQLFLRLLSPSYFLIYRGSYIIAISRINVIYTPSAIW